MGVEGQFGLTKDPFAPVLLPHRFMSTEAHAKALAHLRYGQKKGQGIVVITGDAGVGKSALLDRYRSKCEGDDLHILQLEGKNLTDQSLEEVIFQKLQGLEDVKTDDGLIPTLTELKKTDISVNVLIDEAEYLDDAMLENIRKLSDLFYEGQGLLQFALVGRTPFRRVLYRDHMDKLRRHIVASYHIPPLNSAEITRYVSARLKAAGAIREDIFDARALDALADVTEGVLRHVNIIGRRALENAAAADRMQVKLADIDAAKKEDGGNQEVSTDGPKDDKVIGARLADTSEEESHQSSIPDLKARSSVSVQELNTALQNLFSPETEDKEEGIKQDEQSELADDIWGPVSPISDEEISKLDTMSFAIAGGEKDDGSPRALVNKFLHETKNQLQSLRSNVDALERSAKELEEEYDQRQRAKHTSINALIAKIRSLKM